MLIHSDNLTPFQARIPLQLQKKTGLMHLKRSYNRINPELFQELSDYLTNIENCYKDYKIAVINIPFSEDKNAIPDEQLFCLVQSGYPEEPGSQSTYAPLYKKIRKDKRDDMQITLQDIKSISEKIQSDSIEWKTDNILKNYRQDVLDRGERINTEANELRKQYCANLAVHAYTPSAVLPQKTSVSVPIIQKSHVSTPSVKQTKVKTPEKRTPDKASVNQQPVRKPKNPIVSKVIQKMYIKPVVSPYRIPENPLMTVKYENQLPGMIIERGAEKFNKDLQILCEKYPKLRIIRQELPKLKKLLKDDKLIYIEGKNGYDEVWLASELGKPNASAIYDAPIYNTIALKQLVKKLQKKLSSRQMPHIPKDLLKCFSGNLRNRIKNIIRNIPDGKFKSERTKQLMTALATIANSTKSMHILAIESPLRKERKSNSTALELFLVKSPDSCWEINEYVPLHTTENLLTYEDIIELSQKFPVEENAFQKGSKLIDYGKQLKERSTILSLENKTKVKIAQKAKKTENNGLIDDIDKIVSGWGKSNFVKEYFTILMKPLIDRELVYKINSKGIPEVWLKSDIGQPGAMPVLARPACFPTDIRRIVKNLEKRKTQKLSVTA